MKAISLYRIRARVSNSCSRSLILNFYSFLNICQKDSLPYLNWPSAFDLEKRAQVSSILPKLLTNSIKILVQNRSKLRLVVTKAVKCKYTRHKFLPIYIKIKASASKMLNCVLSAFFVIFQRYWLKKYNIS